MKLIDQWRQSWRLWSVRVSAAGAAVFGLLIAAPDQALAIWQALPPEAQALVPNAKTTGLILLSASAVARVLRQRSQEPR